MQQRVCLHGFLAAAAADVDVSDFCWLFYDQAVKEFFYIGLSSICFISCLDSCYQTYVILKWLIGKNEVLFVVHEFQNFDSLQTYIKSADRKNNELHN